MTERLILAIDVGAALGKSVFWCDKQPSPTPLSEMPALAALDPETGHVRAGHEVAHAKHLTHARSGGIEALGDSKDWDETDALSPVDAVAAIIRALLDEAQERTGASPTDVTLAVPAHFGNHHISALMQAAHLCGLDHARRTSAPVAAAIWHADARGLDRGVFIVYDMGAGFNVAVVTVADDEVRVVASQGDRHIGGQAFDAALVQYITDHSELDHELVSADATQWLHLRNVAERARVRVSTHEDTIAWGQLCGTTIEVPLDRTTLERLITAGVDSSIALTDRVLADAASTGVAGRDIDGVILTGGVTQTPLVRVAIENWVGSHLSSVTPVLADEPVHATALGLALIASGRTAAAGAWRGPKNDNIAWQRPPAQLQQDAQPEDALGERCAAVQELGDETLALIDRMDAAAALDRMRDWIKRTVDEARSAYAAGDQEALQSAHAKLLQFAETARGRVAESTADGDSGDTSAPPLDEERPPAGATTEVPGGTIDRVDFTMTAPPAVRAGASFSLSVWAHLQEQREDVIARARQALGRPTIVVPAEHPASLQRGACLTVSVHIDRMSVEPAEKPLLWEGEVASAGFQVRVPRDTDDGDRTGRVVIYAGGEIASIFFTIVVGSAMAKEEQIEADMKRHASAFASYASKDRENVLARIQGMETLAPDIDIFFDRVSLRTGDYWEKVIEKEIRTRDVLYLFWSRSAAKSEYVDWEWRLGYRERGETFICPVPLEPPDLAPPPEELAGKHFDHWALAYMRNRIEGAS